MEVRVNGRLCAAKKLHGIFNAHDVPLPGKAAMAERFERECRRVLQLKHPNIVEMIGVHFDRTTQQPTLVMELLDISLCSYLEDNPVASATKYSILIDVATGLVYLHTLPPPLGPIVHRDLTASNILLALGDKLVAKIADLGQAKNDPAYTAQRQKLSQVPGNEDHMPPEAWLDEPMYNTSLDIFSFGVVMLHTLVHKWPKPLGRLVSATEVRLEVDRRKSYLDQIDGSLLKPLVMECLGQKPEERPVATVVLGALKMGKHCFSKITSLREAHSTEIGTLNQQMQIRVNQLQTVAAAADSVKQSLLYQVNQFRVAAIQDKEQIKSLQQKVDQLAVQQIDSSHSRDTQAAMHEQFHVSNPRLEGAEVYVNAADRLPNTDDSPQMYSHPANLVTLQQSTHSQYYDNLPGSTQYSSHEVAGNQTVPRTQGTTPQQYGPPNSQMVGQYQSNFAPPHTTSQGYHQPPLNVSQSYATTDVSQPRQQVAVSQYQPRPKPTVSQYQPGPRPAVSQYQPGPKSAGQGWDGNPTQYQNYPQTENESVRLPALVTQDSQDTEPHTLDNEVKPVPKPRKTLLKPSSTEPDIPVKGIIPTQLMKLKRASIQTPRAHVPVVGTTTAKADSAITTKPDESRLDYGGESAHALRKTIEQDQDRNSKEQPTMRGRAIAHSGQRPDSVGKKELEIAMKDGIAEFDDSTTELETMFGISLTEHWVCQYCTNLVQESEIRCDCCHNHRYDSLI